MAQEAQGYPGYQSYGGYGQAMDPAAMRAKLAMAMMERGSDSSPIRSPWQGAARMSNALFGALMMRQMQDSQNSSWQKALAGMPTAAGGGLASGGTPGGFSGGEGSPGLPAQPGALADLANDPDIMRGVANAGANGLPDSATIGQSLEAGHSPPPVGPPIPGMAPNNAAGGNAPGYMGTTVPRAGTPAVPGSMAPTMTAQNAFLHNSVAGPGAPSTILPSGGPSPGNGPGAFNPQDLAMFQQDMQAAPGTLGGGGGGTGGPLLGRLTSMGYSPQAAAGIIGNFQQESSLNPSIIGDQGTSGGLGQWHGSRFTNLQNFAQSQGGSWKDPNIQLAFADREIKADPQLYQSLNGAQTPQQAALIFQNGFERPAPATANTAGREAYAAQALNGVPNSPALGAIQGAAGPPGGLNGPPGSMQPHMMVAGPGVPSGARGGAPPPMPPQPPPDQGGGGNPLSALGNMFGMSNPSGPQGGNGPAPAGGGAGGQAVDPRMRQLMEVISDPYAAPGAKQVAMQFLQYYLPHPTEWRTNPGTNDQQGFNPMTGQPIQGQFRSGPHQFEPIDFGTDFNGQAQKGFIDKNTGQPFVFKDGQLVPLNPGQGRSPASAKGASPSAPAPPSATGSSVSTAPPNSIPPGNIPPPNPAWMPGASSAPGVVTGPAPAPTDWTKGLDERQAAIMQNPGQYSGSLARVPQAQLGDVMSEARAIVEGRQQPYGVTGIGPTKPYEQAVKDAVRAIDPAYTSTRYDSIKDFNGSTQGSTGGQITQGRTGIGHLRAAMELSQQLNQNQSGIGNMPIVGPLYNEMIGNQKQKDVAGAYTEAVTKANSELTRFYLGAPGSAGEREEGLRNELSASANPDVRNKALKELAELANSKIQKLQERWHAGTGGNMPDYPILQPADQESFNYTQSFGRLGDKNAPASNDIAPSGKPWGPAHSGGSPTNPMAPSGVTHVWTPNGGLKSVGAQ